MTPHLVSPSCATIRARARFGAIRNRLDPVGFGGRPVKSPVIVVVLFAGLDFDGWRRQSVTGRGFVRLVRAENRLFVGQRVGKDRAPPVPMRLPAVHSGLAFDWHVDPQHFRAETLFLARTARVAAMAEDFDHGPFPSSLLSFIGHSRLPLEIRSFPTTSPCTHRRIAPHARCPTTRSAARRHRLSRLSSKSTAPNGANSVCPTSHGPNRSRISVAARLPYLVALSVCMRQPDKHG